MKITYDLNNKEECEEIENYYFFKYYLKSLLFDWKNNVDKVIRDNNINPSYGVMCGDPQTHNKQLHNILSEAIKHLNHHEFKRIKDIYFKERHLFTIIEECINDEKYLFLNIICWAKYHIKEYKNCLLKKYGEKH